MNEDNEILLNRVISTLNLIEVRGKENLDMMLGCIQVLERILKPSPEVQQPSLEVHQNEKEK